MEATVDTKNFGAAWKDYKEVEAGRTDWLVPPEVTESLMTEQNARLYSLILSSLDGQTYYPPPAINLAKPLSLPRRAHSAIAVIIWRFAVWFDSLAEAI